MKTGKHARQNIQKRIVFIVQKDKNRFFEGGSIKVSTKV